MSDDDWKDLEIGNIPSDFFVNERYEYRYQFTCDNTWSLQTKLTPLEFIKFMQNNTTKYRYRLKPLEPIKVTRKVLNDLLYCIGNMDQLVKLYGRPLEIIE